MVVYLPATTAITSHVVAGNITNYMKRIFILSFALASLSLTAQKNSLLNQDFWKNNPSVAAVQAEINNGNDPAELNPNAFDPATLAINNGASFETITFLIEQKGNPVNKLTHDARTYLHWAAYKGNAAVVKYLISKGYNINLEDSHGYAPLPFAAANGIPDTETYEAFFKAGIDPKKKYSNGANILLLSAPNDKNLSVTDYLITKGLTLKDTDANGATAFDYAARTGNTDNLKLLIKRGVKPTGYAVLFAAQGARRSANTLEVYKYLIDEVKLKATATGKDGENALHYISKKPNQTDIVAYFLSKGVDVNKADNEGNTPLINAAGGRDTTVITAILAKTSNINAVNAKGESALSAAVKSGTPETVSLLLEKGADSTVKDKDGNNLGFYLVQSYRPQQPGENSLRPEKDDFTAKIKILQNKGFNFATPQKDGSTLYHLAVAKGDIALFKKLEGLKQDVNTKNKAGLTALHKAALTSKDDVVLKYLLSIGAKKDITTEFDETAYALAKENEYLTKNNISVDFLK